MEKYLMVAKRAIESDADFALEHCKFQSREHDIELFWVIEEFQKAFTKKVKSLSIEELSNTSE